LGISVRGKSIKRVTQGSQADGAGIEAGYRIIAANGEPFKEARLSRLVHGKEPYTLTVKGPSTVRNVVQMTTLCLKIPAALMGFLLLLGMIPSYLSHQRMGSDWQEDLLARSLAHPATMVSVGAFMCGTVIRIFIDSDNLTALGQAATVLYCFGLLRSLIGVLASPLLAAPLSEIAVTRWCFENKCMWLVATLAVLLQVTRATDHCVNKSIHGFQDVTTLRYCSRRLAGVMLDLLLLEVVAAITRILGAVEDRFLQLQNALSCKAADFSEQVHTLCAELVNDTGPQLAPLGFPMLCLTLRMLNCAFHIYRVVMYTVSSDLENPDTKSYITAASLSVEFLAIAFAIAVGPFRLSSALADLFERLDEVRCNTHELHAQVRAVELMLERANNRRGWGIKVCRGIVLNKEFLQTVSMRAALLTTAVVAFVDSQMGFEKVEGDNIAIEAELSGIRHILTNITTHLHNHT
jgi:hypothetical protein